MGDTVKRSLAVVCVTVPHGPVELDRPTLVHYSTGRSTRDRALGSTSAVLQGPWQRHRAADCTR